MLEAGRRVPADRQPTIFAVGDVEGTVDEDGEAQPGAAAKLQHSDAALDAVFERHQAHAGKLREGSGTGGDVAARHGPPVEFDHESIPVVSPTAADCPVFGYGGRTMPAA